MQKLFYPDQPPHERERILRDTCEKVVEGYNYTRLLTEEELNEERYKLSEVELKLDALEIEKKDTLDYFKERMAPYKEGKAESIRKLRTRAEERCETVYQLIDYDEAMAGFYNSEGELIHSRPILPEERQTSIRPISKTSNS